MAVNVEVARNVNENSLSLLRRFTKRVQGSGVLPRVRGIRYTVRELSFYKRKKRTLEKLARKAEVNHLIKMGKMTPDIPGQKRKK